MRRWLWPSTRSMADASRWLLAKARAASATATAESSAEQRHQTQELLGPVQGLAHFGAAAFQRFHTHAMQALGQLLRPAQIVLRGPLRAAPASACAATARR
jgi:hypothetical protein